MPYWNHLILQLSRDIMNIIGKYLMIDKRTVRINKNETINHLDYIRNVISGFDSLIRKSIVRCGIRFSSYKRYYHKYDTESTDAIDYYVRQIDYFT